MLRPQEVGTLQSAVLQILRDRILDNTLPPGTELNQAAIAQQLGVSRGPVRECLRALEAEGLVVSTPRKKTVVAPFDETDVEELAALRILLEGFAAKWAAENASAEDIQRLRAITQRMKSLRSRGTSRTFAELDAEFHTALVSLPGYRHLLRIWKSIFGHVQRFFQAGVDYRNQVEAHMTIIEAIENRDSARVQECIRAHIEEAKEEILQSRVFSRNMFKALGTSPSVYLRAPKENADP